MAQNQAHDQTQSQTQRAGHSKLRYVGPEDFSEVAREELEYLYPEEAAADEAPPLTGLAISGGGIRSASFGLGVLQALAKAKWLSKIDYLSTVSGGGYIGSSLTWFLKDGLPDGSPAGTTPDRFPFGRERREKGTGVGEGNRILGFIRQHGNYLTPGRGLGGVSLLAVLLRAVAVSLFVYGGLLTALMAGGRELGAFEDLRQGAVATTPLGAWIQGFLRADVAAPFVWLQASMGAFENPLQILAAGLMAAFVLLSLLYGVLSSFKRSATYVEALEEFRIEGEGAGYRMRTGAQWGFGVLLWAAACATVLGVLPLAHGALRDLGGLGDLSLGGAAGGSTVIGTLLGILQAKAQQSEAPAGGLRAALRLYGGVALLLFGVVLGSFALASALPLSVCVGVGIVALLVGAFTNLNYLNLHRMYRDRLMETFLPNRQNVLSGKWGRATQADDLTIESVCEEPNRRPYHLVNTNVVLVDSARGKYRGRGGESFAISRLYCGSKATGWCRSESYMKRSGRGMTLSTAMAISGAAANPNTGVAGRGPTRSRLVSILMSILNLRLGYWAPNPARGSIPVSPNFLWPGLPAVFGRGLDEERRMIELTDGGHFENLGLYELIRRRVDRIIVSDGGCDRRFEFGDLSNAVERVRVDFGVTVSFEGSEFDLRGLLPGSAPSGAVASTGEKLRLAQRGFALGTIDYPGDEERGLDPKQGELLLLKTTLIAGLPPDLYRYKQAHPDFPDETTADQFFDESQFEAYCELGYQIGDRLLKARPGPL